MLNESLNDSASFETIPSYTMTMNAQVMSPPIHTVYDDDDDVMWEDEQVDDDSSESPGVLIVPPGTGQSKPESLETEGVDNFPAATTNMKLSLPDSLPSDLGSVQETSQGQDHDDDIHCKVPPEQQPTLETNPTLETTSSNQKKTPAPPPAPTPTPAPAPLMNDMVQALSFLGGESRKQMILFVGLAWLISIAPTLYLLADRQRSLDLTLELKQEVLRLHAESQATQAKMALIRNEDLLRNEQLEKLAAKEKDQRATVFSEEQVRRIRQEAQEQVQAVQSEKQALLEEEVRRIRQEAQQHVDKVKHEKEMLLEAEILRLRDEAAYQAGAVQAEKDKVLKEQIDVLQEEAKKQAWASEAESKRRLQDEIRRLQREVRQAQEEQPLKEDLRLTDWLKFTWENEEERNLDENCWLHAKANVGLGECGVDATQKVKKELKRWGQQAVEQGKNLWRAQENLFERWEDYGKKLHDLTTDVFKRNSSETEGANPSTESKEGSTGKKIGLVAATVLASGVAYASLANILSDSESDPLPDEDFFDFFP